MICIYKIVFKNNSFYIGQTINFEKRKYQHQYSKGKGSPLLQKAWEYDSSPTFVVVEECVIEELDAREIYWIEHLKPDLNVLPGGKSNRGLNSPKSKYTKSQIEDIVWYWCNTTMTKAEISHATGVQYSSVCDVVAKRNHQWSTEGIDMSSYERKNFYKIYDPLGNCFTGTSLDELETKTNIPKSGIYSLIKSKTGESRSGWTTFPPQMFVLQSPDGEEVTLTKALCKTLLEDSGLSPYQVERLIKYNKSSAGWKIITCPQKGD